MQQFVNGAMPRHGLRWSSEHDRVLAKMAEAGATKEDVAKAVQRTPLGVYERAKALGIFFKRHLAWEKHEDAALRAGLAAGWSRKRTAKTIANRSLDSLSMRAKRLGLGFKPGNRNDLWKEHGRLERAKAMWTAGSSGLEIAQTFNCGLSRAAVIAKMLRAGLHRPSPRAAPKPKKACVRKAPRRPVGIKVTVQGKPAFAYPMSQTQFVLTDIRTMRLATKKLPTMMIAANDVARVPLEDLQANHCRWIPGDPKEIPRTDPLYCGHQRQAGLPYCARHSGRAFRVAGAARFFPHDDPTQECN